MYTTTGGGGGRSRTGCSCGGGCGGGGCGGGGWLEGEKGEGLFGRELTRAYSAIASEGTYTGIKVLGTIVERYGSMMECMGVWKV